MYAPYNQESTNVKIHRKAKRDRSNFFVGGCVLASSKSSSSPSLSGMIWSSLPHGLWRASTSSKFTLGSGTNDGLTGMLKRLLLPPEDTRRGCNGRGDWGMFRALAPRLARGVKRDRAVDGAVDGVDAALNIED